MNSRPVHSLILSSHFFFCLPCVLPPFTVPCKTVLARPDERKTCPYHCSLCHFTMVRSSCGPIARLIFARTSSLVTWSLYEMRSTLRQHLTSMEIDSVNEDGPALVYIDARVYPLSLTYPQCIKIQPNIKTNHSSFLLLNPRYQSQQYIQNGQH